MAINLRSNFSDMYLEDALPSLEFIVQDQFERFAPFFEKIFNVRDMRGSIAQSTQVSGYRPASIVGESEEIPMQRRYQGFDKTYLAIKLGILCGQSQELIDDAEFEVMADNARQLSDAVMESIHIAVADVFNSGLPGGTAGPDGQTLFSTAHPLVSPGAGTDSNLLGTPADLDATSLKALVTLLRAQKDMAGKKIHIKPSKLIVPKELEFTAVELLQSEMLVNTSNDSVNAVNAVKSLYGIEPVVNDYLTDGDAYFLAGDKANHKLMFYWRKKPELSTDYDFRTETALQKISARYAVGYSDWRGLCGSQGAG